MKSVVIFDYVVDFDERASVSIREISGADTLMLALANAFFPFINSGGMVLCWKGELVEEVVGGGLL